MREEKNIKLYPKTTKDESGIKFFFDNGWFHYTIRFAGNPIMLLEFLYKKEYWEDFYKAYDDAKTWIRNEWTRNLQQCIKKVNEYLELLEYIASNWKSPYVVYVKEFNDFKN